MLLQTVFTVASATLASAASVLVNRASITEFSSSPVSFSWPEGRPGFSAATASKAPCGGASTGPRTQYPLTNGKVSLTQSTPVDNLNILYTKGDDVTRFHQFATYTNTVKDISAGHYCAPGPDFASLGFKAGDDATLLIIYNLDGQSTGLDGTYYECADITLVPETNFTAPEKMMCGNYTTELVVESPEDSLHLNGAEGSSGLKNPHTSGGNDQAPPLTSTQAPTEERHNGLSAAAGGGIGAGVTVGVVLILAAALYLLGLVHFGRRQVTLDDHSSTNSLTKQVRA